MTTGKRKNHGQDRYDSRELCPFCMMRMKNKQGIMCNECRRMADYVKSNNMQDVWYKGLKEVYTHIKNICELA